MNKTKNYSLNQWALEDRIRMEDFNADNANLEKALTDLDGKINSAQSGLDTKFDGKIAALNSRKLEAVVLADATLEANGTETRWYIPMDPEEIAKSLVVFFYFETFSGNTFLLGAGDGGQASATLMAGNSMVAIYPLGVKNHTIGFIPLDGYSSSNRACSGNAAIPGVTLTIPGYTPFPAGTYRCKAIALR